MHEITAVLFCGGRGSRLYPVTDYYQKVMMPIGSEGKPMLEYVISWLKVQGITKFIALIKYRANQIRRYFGNGERWGVEITYVVDDPSLQGTGGALLNAKDYITTDMMLIYFTDILSNVKLEKVIEDHQRSDKIATVLLDDSWILEEDIIRVDEDHSVREISHLSNNSHFVNTGISLLNYSIFDHLENALQHTEPPRKSIDLSSDIIPKLAAGGLVKSHFIKDWWLDIGSITRHQMLSDELLQSKFGGVIDQ